VSCHPLVLERTVLLANRKITNPSTQTKVGFFLVKYAKRLAGNNGPAQQLAAARDILSNDKRMKNETGG
jgi:hypothetical protein